MGSSQTILHKQKIHKLFDIVNNWLTKQMARRPKMFLQVTPFTAMQQLTF
jgi:hypothetical protein